MVTNSDTPEGCIGVEGTSYYRQASFLYISRQGEVAEYNEWNCCLLGMCAVPFVADSVHEADVKLTSSGQSRWLKSRILV